MYILGVLRSYGIAMRIGYYIGNNATSNDILLKVLLSLLLVEYNIFIV